MIFSPRNQWSSEDQIFIIIRLVQNKIQIWCLNQEQQKSFLKIQKIVKVETRKLQNFFQILPWKAKFTSSISRMNCFHIDWSPSYGSWSEDTSYSGISGLWFNMSADSGLGQLIRLNLMKSPVAREITCLKQNGSFSGAMRAHYQNQYFWKSSWAVELVFFLVHGWSNW